MGRERRPQQYHPRVCSPLPNSTLPASQPFAAYARGTVPSGSAVVRMELRADGVKKYTAYGDSLRASLTLASGWHSLTYYLIDNSGTSFKDKFNVEVK